MASIIRWKTSLAGVISLLLLTGIALAGQDDVIAAPSLESLVRVSPWLALIVLVVRWFMLYIETKDKSYVAAISAKDEAYLALVRECQTELRAMNTQLVACMQQIAALLARIGHAQPGQGRPPEGGSV
jgi:hypothetical protein